MAELKISSPGFKNGDMIPSRYTMEGKNINPQLEFNDVPPEAKSLVLIVDDPDAPEKTWVHWLVFNIPPTNRILENSKPGILGTTSLTPFNNSRNYSGPYPPNGTHRYFFKVYALDRLLDLKEDTIKEEVEDKMRGHIISRGEIMGLYRRVNV